MENSHRSFGSGCWCGHLISAPCSFWRRWSSSSITFIYEGDDTSATHEKIRCDIDSEGILALELL